MKLQKEGMPLKTAVFVSAFLLICVLQSCSKVGTQGNETPAQTAPLFEQLTVFSAGEDGYHCFRIPALVVTAEGTILAFSEARKLTCHDDAEIDLVLKRSFDQGKTWQDLQVLFDYGTDSVNQPAPVLDRETGEVVLVFCRNNQRVFVTKTLDDGVTWSEPAEITKDVVDPAWSYIGSGPGHGIQLSSGRLLIPSWGDTSPGPATWPRPGWGGEQFSYVMYSDDHGATWKRGKSLDMDLSDEAMAVETADGSIYMNMRSRREKRMRAFAWSEDGGVSWSPVQFDQSLPEPSVQGSVIRFTDEERFSKNRVLLAHPSSQTERKQFTVRMSYDECRTWPVSKVVHEGSAAYSDLAVADDMTILSLYEADQYSKLALARFNLEWLTDGNDSLQRTNP
jgi:sialidase-1